MPRKNTLSRDLQKIEDLMQVAAAKHGIVEDPDEVPDKLLTAIALIHDRWLIAIIDEEIARRTKK